MAKNRVVEAPPAFRSFALGFALCSPVNCANEREWIASVLLDLGRSCKVELKKFLTDLLSKNPTEAELQELWNAAQDQYYIAGKNAMRIFLTLTLEQLEYDLSSASSKTKAPSAHDKTRR